MKLRISENGKERFGQTRLDSQRFYLWRGTSKFVWKFLFTPNRFHLCFVNFIWCMRQQTKNIVYMRLKSVQMFAKEGENSLHTTVVFLSVWCS